MKQVFKRMIVSVLAAAMVITSVPEQTLAAVKINGYTDSADGDQVKVVSQKSYALVQGVTETDLVLNDQTGDAQVKAYMTTISADANVSLKATYDGYYEGYDKSTGKSSYQTGTWGLSTTSKQVADYEKATGENVIFATNGDYFNMQTGQPSGVLFMNGTDYNPSRHKSEAAYFAVLKDGSYAIRDGGSDMSDVVEAVGSPFYLVKNGENAAVGMRELYPVNSVGFKADGTVVFFMADGRQYPNSVGMSQEEMADFLIAQGVVTAIYLDGGGSATVITQREGEQTQEIRNSPSDGGERSISSGFLLVAKDEPDGIFDHVAVTPDGDLYTPGSSVAFELTGVDRSGAPADLPETGLSFALSEEAKALGSIDETGVFTSNGSCGTVDVIVSYEGNTVGSASIKVVEPDELYFDSTSISLDFGESSDLGFVVRSNHAPVHYKDGDFDWTILDAEGNPNAAIGSMNGNLFAAGEGSGTMNGIVQVSCRTSEGSLLTASIEVEIGKMPYVAFDYEPVDGVVQTAGHYHWGGGRAGLRDAFLAETNGGYYGDVSPITVYTSGTYTDHATQETLEAPYNFSGNWDSAVPASDIFRANGYSYYLWPNASITTFNTGSLQTVSEADGGQVRFGDYSLALNYDFRSYDSSKNSNWYMRYCGEAKYLEGVPNQIGVWVYADEKSYGFCLYADVMAWNGSDYSTKNFALKHVGKDGEEINWIDWTGWMYCYSDTSSLAAYYSEEHPLAMIPGYGMLWLSYQPGTGRAGKYAGTLYFDNLRFVYGTDLDDLDNPVIGDICVNGTAVDEAGSVTIDSSEIELTAVFDDYEGKNMSGVDASKTIVKVDGETVVSDGDAVSTLTRLTLGNGLHSASVTVYDGFGNYSTKTVYFNIDQTALEGSAVLTGPETVTMGAPYEMTLTSIGQVCAVSMNAIQLNSDFGEPVITFADGFTGTGTYTITGFKKAKFDLTAEWTGEGEVPADTVIAVLSFSVPAEMDPAIDFFTCQVAAMKSTLPDGSVMTAAQPMIKLSLSAYYTVSAAVAVAGFDTELTVTDVNGDPASDVTVYVNDAPIGNTDENGRIATDVTRTMAGGSSFNVYAKKDSLVSFTTAITVMASSGNADGSPAGIALSAAKDGSSEQIVSWLSGAAESKACAYVVYGSDEALSDGVTVSGDSRLQAFTTSKNAARINTVTITDLAAGSTFYYKVGDGETWSEIKSFTTAPESNTTSFFVIGDTQMNGNPASDADEIALLDKIGQAVSGTEFGIQTGDFIDNGGNYSMWEEMQNVFGSSFATTDMLHTMGNHEYYGDADGTAAAAIYGLEGTDALYYSVEYGNVYAAVINYNANLTEALAWLVEDAKASDCRWKVLSIHQPPYYTNVNGGSDRFNALVPAAAQEAGINVVFSGHDHSYARTLPMTNGEVDEENGVTYFICGDLGEKSRNINYAAVNTESFHFAAISQDYDALYLYVTADAFGMEIEARKSDGTVIDSVRIGEENPCVEGHTWALYDRDTDELICSECGERENAADTLYGGFAKDLATDGSMYFAGGRYLTGYQYLSSAVYYFDEDGIAFEGDIEIGGETCQFSEGQYVASSNPEVVTAGLCGPEAQFVLYADGTFKITGSGSMYVFTGYGAVPWASYQNKIKHVKIAEGITDISNYSFRSAYKIEDVDFGENSSLTSIGKYAFTGLTHLSELVLPDSVRSISAYAFYSCSGITSIYLPDDVDSIHSKAFYKSSNVVLSVAANSYAHEWAKNAGVAYVVREMDPDTLIAQGSCGDNASYTLTYGGLLTITGNGAITTGDTYSSAAWYSNRTRITSVTISKDITSIGAFAFYGCSNLENVTFEEGSALTRIYKYAFANCSALNNLVIPEGVTRLDYAVFQKCTSMTDLYLPDNIKAIDTRAFSGSENVTVSVAGGSYAAARLAELGVSYVERALPAITGKCGDTAEWSLDADGILTISGSGAVVTGDASSSAPWYEYRSRITGVVIGKDVTSLGAFAFFGCSNLLSVSFEEGSAMNRIYKYAFASCTALTELVIPDGVTRIDYAVFKNCKSLSYVYLPDEVNKIDSSAFAGADAVNVSVAAGSYAAERLEALGLAYTERSMPAITGSCGDQTEWSLGADGVLTIKGSGLVVTGDSAATVPWYSYRSLITAVVVDKRVTSIGAFAFSACTNLESIAFEEGSELTSIGKYAFASCASLTEIVIPDGVSKLNYAVLKNCTELAYVYLPDGMKTIDTKAFAGSEKVICSVKEGSAAQTRLDELMIAYTVR